jgi:hypothetical protein
LKYSQELIQTSNLYVNLRLREFIGGQTLIPICTTDISDKLVAEMLERMPAQAFHPYQSHCGCFLFGLVEKQSFPKHFGMLEDLF